ncbi:DUF6708 domain-containing protein [Pseudomonas sp. AFG_SD02_1510_Pfu_092]|uniref:DUF6708 domain-containing protein n=1 Tax=Pseudomonas sp. AFG_SD02_1510_Pfu_092 TaxID=2259497 RepID=UPI001F4DFE49|nr:DUF6708 domain-containing protein [Pseudomonas sp. AFG_SD02_1510_Pfu_092]
MPRPLLNPPCTGWVEDLPHPDALPTIEASLGNQSANHLDSIYLEVPRTIGLAREIIFLLTLLTIAFTILQPGPVISSFTDRDFGLLLLDILILACEIWASVFFIRVSIGPPRDEPLRFNRARRKMYAYNFKHCWWKPFGTWKVEAVCYDWSQVRAERWSQTGVLPNGGVVFKWGVMLSIVAPGTNNVIDRFRLNTMGADQHAWAYICTYMRQGPSALPPPGEPKDHNDVLWCEFALRLAPKVNWPTDIDLESRTAP